MEPPGAMRKAKERGVELESRMSQKCISKARPLCKAMVIVGCGDSSVKKHGPPLTGDTASKVCYIKLSLLF